MSNRTFLYVWFPLSWVITTAISFLVVRLLLGPVVQLASRISDETRRFLSVMFPAGVVLPVFAAFLSICYFHQGCTGYTTSQEVIASDGWLQHTAQLQMSAIFTFLVYVLFVWSVIYAVLLIAWKKTRTSA